MATVSESRSLEEILYKSKIKIALLVLLVTFVFLFAFINTFPIGGKVKSLIRSQLKGTGCNADFDDIRVEFFLPKIVISDLTLPSQCLGRQGAPLKLNFVNINWHVINFSPFGTPFRFDTELQGQTLSVYYVLGINQQMIRLKDQEIKLARLDELMKQFKLGGALTLDLSLLTSKNIVKGLSFKAVSKDLVVPSQSVEGLTLPALRVNDFYLEADSEAHPKITVEKLIIGDSKSPIRANFKGRIDLVSGNLPLSPLNLSGEVAFSENFKQKLPLIDMMFQAFAQKDGFYQIRLGGTLAAPKPMAP